jgi:hypothetical protein
MGNDHPEALHSANRLAADLRELGEYQQARVLDEDTLARRRRMLGDGRRGCVGSGTGRRAPDRAGIDLYADLGARPRRRSQAPDRARWYTTKTEPSYDDMTVWCSAWNARRVRLPLGHQVTVVSTSGADVTPASEGHTRTGGHGRGRHCVGRPRSTAPPTQAGLRRKTARLTPG